ncbi:MAG: hypothetical protein ACBR50_00345 [Microcoleus sp.]
MFLRLGLSDRAHTASDGYGKAAIARSARPYTATHHPHHAFVTVNTSDTSPDAHTPARTGEASSWRCYNIFGF